MVLYGSTTVDAYGLLALALRRDYGIDALPTLKKSIGGKPYCPEDPDVHFSVSHSGRFSLCCVDNAPVGADIEEIRPRRQSLPRYVLSQAEYRRYEALGGRWEEFYAIWTLKESRVKQEGGNIYPPRGVTVPLPPGGEADGLRFQSYEGEGFRAAVCAQNSPPECICFL